MGYKFKLKTMKGGKKMKNKAIWIVLGIIALISVIGIVWFVMSGEKEIENGISVDCFDINQQPIDCQTGQSLSVVGGTPGIYYLGFTVSATNDGDIPLTCQIVGTSDTSSSTGTPFDLFSNLPTDQRILPNTGTKKLAWATTSLIEVGQFENLPSPTSFFATVRCSYVRGNAETILPDVTYKRDMLITADNVNTGFSVEINEGGIGSEVCGNGVCDPSETSSSCPTDCGFVTSNVRFRASDITYTSGSAIGLTSTCGNALTQYGWAEEYEQDKGSADSCADFFVNEIASPLSHQVPCLGKPNTCYVGYTIGDSMAYVCWIKSSSFYEIVKYTTSSTYKGNVDTTPTGYSPGTEVIC